MRCYRTFWIAFGLLILVSQWQASPALGRNQPEGPLLVPFKASGIYEEGEIVGWTVHRPEAPDVKALKYNYTVKKNDAEVIASGELDLTDGDQRIELQVSEPAMLYADVTPVEGATARNSAVAGAAVAPTKLKPVAPRPANFDAFWQAQIALLKKVPENPALTRGDSGVDGVDYGTIRMNHLDGGHIYGQYARPKDNKKHPALLILQWASPPYPLEKSWVVGHAAKGWIVLNIEPHDVLPTEPKAYYDALANELKHYERIGWDDRNKSYFRKMYLADYRAADHLANDPAWDGKTLVVMGTSMGGQQALCVAGLHPKITHLIVNVPAGCDLNAPLHGRSIGYPFFPADNPQVMETARYFDAVNFAPHIKARSLVAMGFVDTTCPPAGIWTAYNQITGPKEAAPMIESPHNHLATPEEQAPYTRLSARWLDTLVKGREVLADKNVN
jgi:cephalosporin-C deacetylase-like acetyl esterase